MRQFVLEYEDDENDILKKMCEPYDSKIVYRKQRLVKMLSSLAKVRYVSTDLRKAAITSIIKYDFYTFYLQSR